MGIFLRLIQLAMLIFVVGGIVVFVRRSRSGSGSHQLSDADALGVVDPSAARRLSEVAPDEEFLAAIPARRMGKKPGWLIATSKRLWWIYAPVRGASEATEVDYTSMVEVTGGSLFRLPVLVVAAIPYATTLDDATAMSQAIRRQRDGLSAGPATAVSTPRAAESASVADELAKFAAMRDSGVLTDEEFTKKKRELLG